jgi:hypothetical protein
MGMLPRKSCRRRWRKGWSRRLAAQLTRGGPLRAGEGPAQPLLRLPRAQLPGGPRHRPGIHFAQTAGSVAPSTHPSAGRFTGMAIASLARAGFRPGVHFRDDPSRAAPAAFQPSPLPIDLEFVRVVLCISYVRM